LSVRFLRILLRCVAVLVIAVVALAALAYYERERLAQFVLSSVNSRTGLTITSPHIRLRFEPRLSVILEHPQVATRAGPSIRLGEIRASISYHTLLHSRGLPLHSLVLIEPVFEMPAAAGLLPTGLPSNPREATASLLTGLDAAALVTRRLEVRGASVASPAQAPWCKFDLVASHKVRRPRPWRLRFKASLERAELGRLTLNGRISAGQTSAAREPVVGRAQLWFALDRQNPVNLKVLEMNGRMQGQLALDLNADGAVTGLGNFLLGDLTLAIKNGSRRLIQAGDYSLQAAFDFAAPGFALTKAALNHGNERLAALSGSFQAPYGPGSALRVDATAIEVDLGALKSRLATLAIAPPALAALLKMVDSGRLSIETIGVNTTLARIADPQQVLFEEVRANGHLSALELEFRNEVALPKMEKLGARWKYAGGVVTVDQGAASLGSSHLDAIDGRFELPRRGRPLSYALRAKGELDAGQFYPAVARAGGRFEDFLTRHVAEVSGYTAALAEVEGELSGAQPLLPSRYDATFEPHEVLVKLKGAPVQTVALVQGSATFRPELISFDHLLLREQDARPREADRSPGEAVVNGVAHFGDGAPSVKGTLTLRRIETEPWVAQFVDRNDMAVHMAASGELDLDGQVLDLASMHAHGRLDGGPGELGFGFLRSPLSVEAAALTLNENRLDFAVPAGQLEGKPVSLTLSIADLRHPELQLDADARRLDLEVMKFIRLPWTPPRPVSVFKIPVFGHIDAPEGKLEKLPLSLMKTDYRYDKGKWRVRNFTAQSFGGKVHLDLSGRARDNWITIKGGLDDVNAAPLFGLSDNGRKPPITGKLNLSADASADAALDFFQTLGGKLGVKVKDGRLNHFTLLSRILALIDLKSWLTANIPDPRIAGVPFKVITADFEGSDGVFRTDNLHLKGPVMNASAWDSMNVDSGTIDMQVGVVPFTTVDWLMAKIPLVGKNLSMSSRDIVAAYFHVSGPFSDPKVQPMPIVSMAEFIKRTLSLPINIIAPGTVK
jgi:hypothetical protein